MNTSFEEKSVWVQLFSMVAVLGSYFVAAGLMLARGTTTLLAYVPLFTVAIVVLVLVLVVGHIVAALAARPEARDERDRLIAWRAESNASWILGAGVIAAICGLILNVETVWIAHLLLLSMLLSEIAGYVWQLVYYRRGMAQ